ncbi:site-2 protease family protein [Haloactinopolyspora sp.]|uniref:site-2 protease family protein n=1 Tax=Haloactinopolyspora sp. TaxID=1966353 RepID=UPI002615E5D0|nr:site-2 protease family protein [Haloactinopolyspora sp.]
MRESIRLGTIYGVRVGLNVSVLVIGAIIVVGLAAGRFPAVYPDRSTWAYVVAGVVTAILFFVSLLAHEIAHSVVAIRNGINVRRITLWLLGGVAELEGEPRTPGADFRIAVVGPLTSLAAAVVSMIVAAILLAAGADDLVVGMFAYLAGINVLLAVFNLIPAAPLDGGRVLRAALWAWRGDRARAAVTAAKAGRFFGVFLIVLGIVEVLFTPGLGGLWLVLIGLFLVNVATAEEYQSRLSETLRGVRAGDVMTTDPIAVDPDLPLDRFIADQAWTHRHSSYPLLDADRRLLGLVTLNRVREVRHEDRATTRLRDIACPPEELPISEPNEPLVELLRRMQHGTDGRAVVLDDEHRVVGIISPSDISRAVQVRGLQAFDSSGSREAAARTWLP